MKIQILQVAPTKDKHIAAIEAEYEKRLGGFAELSMLTVKPSKADQRMACQSDEKDRLIEKIDKDAYVIALHEAGPQLTSTAFAELVKDKRDFGPGKLQFIIGGSHGIHPEILSMVDQQLSFSMMTFTHEMIRIVLKEQLYRAFAILAGKTYHK